MLKLISNIENQMSKFPHVHSSLFFSSTLPQRRISEAISGICDREQRII